MLPALMKGFAMSCSLIVAIGAQNAFVIRQGLTCQHLFITAFLCSLTDSLLILIGVLGFGTIVTEYPLAMNIAKYFSVVFLGIYGIFALRSALKTRTLGDVCETVFLSRSKTILIVLALSLLNPHAYLDTVILLGSIASLQPDHEQLYFACGAIVASFAWFFAIAYGSRFLAPFFNRPSSWKIIDGLVAVSMWAIAVTLIFAL